MNPATTATTATAQPTGLPLSTRSPALGQFRANPFRVLRVPTDLGADQAIWKAEETLTRLRAGLPPADPDLLPWLPEPDETETRQAVQRIEEPLRRLTEQVFWFDLERDPDGDLLRRALATLGPALLNDYLARCPDDGLARPVTVRIERAETIRIGLDDVPETNGEPHRDEPENVPEVDAAGVPRLLNHANLRLLLAALSLQEAMPEGLEVAAQEGGDDRSPGPIEWSRSGGLEISENPHQLDLTGGGQAARARRTVALWSDALARWLRLARAPGFLAFVRENIVRLDDEVVGEEDAEAIVNSASTRLTDLLVGEVKAQLLSGRMDRVRALLEVAEASDVEPRRWSMAFRPLRPLLRAEVAELEPLLSFGDDPRFDDIAMYLSRLGTLKRRWSAIDPSGHLGLAEIIDEAGVKVCESLVRLESYEAVDRLKALHSSTMNLASADSLKQRIATAVSRLDQFEHYACHFCRAREMERLRSVVLTGKRESHRTYGFNSTTIHYMLKANIVPRCVRCSNLHEYLWGVGVTTRTALGVGAAASIGALYWSKGLGADAEAFSYIVVAGIAAAAIWVTGIVARWVVTLLATPGGERRYWKASSAKQYREMRSEGCTMTIDYRRNAFELFEKQQQQLQG
jgi:hypothetical protein